jgi:hypothetical protein
MFTYVKSEIYIDISPITKKIMMNTQTSLSKNIKVITQSINIGIDRIRNNIDTRFQGKIYACLTTEKYFSVCF